MGRRNEEHDDESEEEIKVMKLICEAWAMHRVPLGSC